MSSKKPYLISAGPKVGRKGHHRILWFIQILPGQKNSKKVDPDFNVISSNIYFTIESAFKADNFSGKILLIT